MPFIILDRDGVINYDSLEYIKSPKECIAIPGSLEAIAKLNAYGYRVVVATNQSGIARGYYTSAILSEIHYKLRTELAAHGGSIDEFCYCPHHPEDHCPCRKPQPGLLNKLREQFDINLTETYFIGDSLTDIQAARAAGCKPILVLTGNGQKTLAENPELEKIDYFLDLHNAVEHICK